MTPKDGIGWKSVKGDEKYHFLDEMGIGQFVKPEQDEIKSISAADINVPLGQVRYISPNVSPVSAEYPSKFEYSTDDTKIEIGKDGMVKGLEKGSAVVSVSLGDIKAEFIVNVTDPTVGDVDGDGKITIRDATMIQMYLAKLIGLDDKAKKQADIDLDGEITVADVSVLQFYLAKMIYSL